LFLISINCRLSGELGLSSIGASVKERDRLREQAAKCRRLAVGMTDDRTVESLLLMAERYEAEAAELDESHDPENRPVISASGGDLHA
jgi:hypothetical protein